MPGWRCLPAGDRTDGLSGQYICAANLWSVSHVSD